MVASVLKRRWLNRACMAMVAILAAACSSNQVRVEPTKLTSIDAQVDVKRLWSKQIGKGGLEAGATFRPAVSSELIFANDSSGQVFSIERATGKRLWKTNLSRPLVGGIVSDDDYLWVTTRDGFVLALSVEDGTQVWSAALPSQALVPVVVTGQLVIVQTEDGHLTCLNRRDGKSLWVTGTQVPVLSLRGGSRPVVEGSQIIAGFASGKIASFDLKTGQLLWIRQVGQSDGDAELDRLVDIDGDFIVERGAVIAAGYNGGLMAMSVRNGQPFWQQPVSSHRALSAGFDALFASDPEGLVHGFDLRSGEPKWVQKAFKARNLSGLSVVDDWVLVGDFEGYVHILDQDTGEQLARYKVDNSPISVSPIVDNRQDTAYVMSAEGRLVALKLKALDIE